MFYVYLLKSLLFDEFYVGSTNDLKKRMENHNKGEVFSTKRYKPWKLLYYEAYLEEKLARLREQGLKHHGNALRQIKKRVGISQNSAGFTLIELIVAVTIMAVLSSFGIASFVSYSRAQSLNNVTQDFVTALQSAKAATASQVKPTSCANTGIFEGYRVSISSSANTNTYTIGPVCGGTYDNASSKTTVLPMNGNVSFSNISTLKITFNPITGTVTFDPPPSNDYVDIVMRESQSNPPQTKIVRIYSDGRINVR